MKEAGSDWRNSKYLYAISNAQVVIHQSRECVVKLMRGNEALLYLVSTGHDAGNLCRLKDSAYPPMMPNYLPLTGENENINLTKQKSDAWWERRSQFLITGSSLYEGLALDTLDKQRLHVSVVTGEVARPEFDEETLQNMAYGSENEVNGILTFGRKSHA